MLFQVSHNIMYQSIFRTFKFFFNINFLFKIIILCALPKKTSYLNIVRNNHALCVVIYEMENY